MNFYKDFNSLNEASQINKTDLEKDINEIQNELNKIKLEKETKDEDYLLFLNNVEKYSSIKIDCIKISLQILEKEIETCYTTFGELKDKFNLNAFLKSIDNFVELYKAKLLEISQKEAKLLKKKIAEEKKKKKKIEKEKKEQKPEKKEEKIKKLKNIDNNLDNNVENVKINENLSKKLSQEFRESRGRENKFYSDFQKIRETATRKTIARRTAVKKDLQEIKEFIREERIRMKSQSKEKKNENQNENNNNNNNNKKEAKYRYSDYKIDKILEENEDKTSKPKIEKDFEMFKRPIGFGSRQKLDNNAIKLFGQRGSGMLSKEEIKNLKNK